MTEQSSLLHCWQCCW